MDVVDEAVELDAARDDRLLAAADLRIQGLELNVLKQRIPRQRHGYSQLLPSVVDVRFDGDS